MKDVSIVLCGEAGQGIQTVEHVLSRVLKRSGYHVFSTREFMSRIRGGSNSTQIRVSSKPVNTYTDRIDILIPISRNAVDHVKWRITDDTVIIGEKEYIKDEGKLSIELPFTHIAEEVGNKIYANVVAVGVLSGLLNADEEILKDYVKENFKDKKKSVIKDNLDAAENGYERGMGLKEENKIEIEIKKNDRVKNELLLNGTEAVSLGAMAGGCNFISSYPMSPSTGVLVFLSQQAEEFGIVVEQAESEISAINMTLGAWYAGGKGMVTTSGGGFALMVEGLSLSGMLEVPAVIHLGQRPGPATGLPTRTEQGDLLFTLFSGHGEFPRIILTPGTPEEAFNLTRKAFNLADRYQVPVIVLTDQYLLDSSYTVENLDLQEIEVENYMVETEKDYKRYRVTENGISPRGIPGHGKGLVSVDSDEHDEEGHITEDLKFRKEIVDKRLKKEEEIKKDIIPPEFIGNENFKILLVGWGSTYHVIKESLRKIDDEHLAFLHHPQVFPLPGQTEGYLKKAEKMVVIENNATAQFGKLLKLETGIIPDEEIIKYNGLPFSVEELIKSLEEIMEES